jgi:catechol 2,3-dioxygenase-like lactoylglutathione lyase family enzyme
LKYHSAAAFVRDIGISKQFYTEVLGLAVELDFGKNVLLKGGITLWQISPGHILPQRLGIDSMSYQRTHRFEFYFETEDIEAVYARIQTSGVEFLHSMHEEPWGQRTMRLFDPDRHLIEIGESLETFVRRLFNDTKSAEMVAQRTSVPLEKVHEIVGV